MTGIYQVSNYTPCQIGLVKGERGENGANGANGVNGKDGKDGKDGLRGLSGSDGKSNYQLALDAGFIGSLADYQAELRAVKGEDGTDATIDFLPVVTGAAGTPVVSVVSGTPSARTIALTIPKGDDGVDGKSAYQSALDNGFIGTEAEWKLYLKSDGSIQALQQFMTNPASTEVSVPDYGNIPSLQGYISQMFENGGLPATPYATKALMTASALVDGDYAQVTDDTVNNGLYIKTAGAWVKSGYDPLTLAKAADTTLANLKNNQSYVAVASSGVSTYDADMSSNLKGLITGRIMYNPVTKCLHIPQDTIVYKPSGGFVSLPATKVDLTVVGTSLYRVYLNLTTLEFTVRRGVDSISPSQQTTDVLFCSVRDVGTRISIDGTFPYYVGASPYGEVIQNDRLAIISSHFSSASTPVIAVDTVAKTLTIPRDTLARYKGVNISFGSEVVIDLTTVNGGTSSALYLYFNLDTREFVLTRFTLGLSSPSDYYNCVLFCAIRFRDVSGDSTGKCYLDLSAPYMVNGEMFGIGNSGTGVTQNRLDELVKGIAHRGYSTEAPENTLPAYALAKKKGFSYVECDVLFTSDGIPVLLHDVTIDRTSNSSGAISTLTLAQVKEFDFGSWKNAKYAGTKIPTLEEFLDLCRYISLHPYIELKNMTPQQAASVVQIVKDAKMQGKVTYISFTLASLAAITNEDPYSRLGFVGSASNALVDSALTLKNETNEVFADVHGTPAVVEPVTAYATSKGIDLEVWTVNNAAAALEYIEGGAAGITTDALNIRDVLNTKYLG